MSKTQEDDKSLSFVKRWIKAFNRMLQLFGNKQIPGNTEFVDTLLRDEKLNAKTQEDIDLLEEKRRLLKEICDDVDSYYEKKASAGKAANLDDWFENEVRDFVRDTIPDATPDDVKETMDIISQSMDDDIEVRSDLLKSEFATDDTDTSIDNLNKSARDE